MEINQSIQIDCEPPELWLWLTAFERLKKWNSTLIEEQHISSGEVKNGYVTKVLIKEGKKDIWYENEIRDYEPNKHLSIILKGGNLGKSPMVVAYDIIKQNGFVELHYKSTWQPKEFFLRIFKPVIKKVATKNAKNVLSELKKQIER